MPFLKTTTQNARGLNQQFICHSQRPITVSYELPTKIFMIVGYYCKKQERSVSSLFSHSINLNVSKPAKSRRHLCVRFFCIELVLGNLRYGGVEVGGKTFSNRWNLLIFI